MLLHATNNESIRKSNRFYLLNRRSDSELHNARIYHERGKNLLLCKQIYGHNFASSPSRSLHRGPNQCENLVLALFRPYRCWAAYQFSLHCCGDRDSRRRYLLDFNYCFHHIHSYLWRSVSNGNFYPSHIKSSCIDKPHIQLSYCRPAIHDKLASVGFDFNSTDSFMWSHLIRTIWDNKWNWGRSNTIGIIYQRFQCWPSNYKHLNKWSFEGGNLQSKIQSLILKLSSSFIEFWLWHLDKWSLFDCYNLFDFIECHSWNVAHFDISGLGYLRTNYVSLDRYLDNSSNNLWSGRNRIVGLCRRFNLGRSDNRRSHCVWSRKFR